MVEGLGIIDEARVTILAEDTVGFDLPLMGRFGLSMLLEAKADHVEKKILFDTNSAAAPIIKNAAVLGIELSDVGTLFFSHCHYDHTDGLPGILEAINHPLPVIGHPDLFRPCFEINKDGIRQIGMAYPRAELEEKGADFILVKEPLILMSGVITTGEVERVTGYEGLEDLYTTTNGKTTQDQERDDMALVISTSQGLIIMTGCSHSGIVNIILTARRISGIDKIHAVIGGLHLIDANQEKIENSLRFLDENVERVFAGHCTGFEGCCQLRRILGDRFHKITTGMIIVFPGGSDQPLVSTISTNTRDRYRTLYA